MNEVNCAAQRVNFPNSPGKPLLDSGNCVGKYRLTWHEYFIHYGKWLWCEREPQYFEKPKILFHRIRKKLPVQLIGTYDDRRFYNRHSLSNLILREGIEYDLKYVLGLFNSTLLNFWFVKRFGLLMEVGSFKIAQLPVRKIDFSNLEDKYHHEQLVEIVEQMLAVKQEYAAAQAMLEDRRHDMAREIERLDAQIDQFTSYMVSLKKKLLS